MKVNVGFEEAGVDLKHHFSSGVYAKETRIPAGLRLKQHAHPFDHMSILASGTVRVRADGWVESFRGPAVLEMKAGVVHEVEAVTDATWFCLHATDETDPDKVDQRILGEQDAVDSDRGRPVAGPARQ